MYNTFISSLYCLISFAFCVFLLGLYLIVFLYDFVKLMILQSINIQCILGISRIFEFYVVVLNNLYFATLTLMNRNDTKRDDKRNSNVQNIRIAGKH